MLMAVVVFGLMLGPLHSKISENTGDMTAKALADVGSVEFLAEKLFGDDYEWSVLAAGRHQIPFTTQSALLGGNVRVGMEDSLYIGPGEKAVSSAQQVTKIRTIIENLGLSVATPAEARQRLGLKGGDQVAF